jgi:hypothetical protein
MNHKLNFWCSKTMRWKFMRFSLKRFSLMDLYRWNNWVNDSVRISTKERKHSKILNCMQSSSNSSVGLSGATVAVFEYWKWMCDENKRESDEGKSGYSSEPGILRTKSSNFSIFFRHSMFQSSICSDKCIVRVAFSLNFVPLKAISVLSTHNIDISRVTWWLLIFLLRLLFSYNFLLLLCVSMSLCTR